MNYKYILFVTFFLVGCVYFNTFYNAEQSFEKAVRLIDEAQDEDELPSNAKNLLKEAINNSEIVIKKYPESRYVDDAFFIMGKASFFLNDFNSADKYLNRLIYEFPKSPFKNECEIWLTYTLYKNGYADSALVNIQRLLENPPKQKKLKYLLNKIVGDIALSQDSVSTAFNHYETAARLADNNSKRMSLYNKMLLITEKNKDYKKAVYLLEQLELYGTTAQIKQEARLKWLEYNRYLENYDLVLAKIDELLLSPEYEIHHLSLKVEKAKIYLSQKDYSRATDLFKEILENPKNARKGPTSEAAYHLGNLALIDGFDLELSVMYLDSVTQIQRTSSYRKKANNLKAKVLKYQSLEDDYKFAKDSDTPATVPESENVQLSDSLSSITLDSLSEQTPLPEMTEPLQAAPEPVDSLLFTMAEMLLFEFNRIELSMDKYEQLVADYPDSKFVPQSLYVLDRFSAEERNKWKTTLLEKYPNSVYAKALEGETLTVEKSGDMLGKLRDLAWLKLDDSPEKSMESFDKIAKEYDDPISAYNSAYISDKYLYLLEPSIEKYQSFLEKYPDDENGSKAETRLEEIKSAVQSLKNEVVGWVDRYTDYVTMHSKSDTLYLSSNTGVTLFTADHDSVITASPTDTLVIHFGGDSLWYGAPKDSTNDRAVLRSVEILPSNDSLIVQSASGKLITGTTIKIIEQPNHIKFFPSSDSILYNYYNTTIVPHPELDSIYVLLGLNTESLPDTLIGDTLQLAMNDSLLQGGKSDSSLADTAGEVILTDGIIDTVFQMPGEVAEKKVTPELQDSTAKTASLGSTVLVNQIAVTEKINDPTVNEMINGKAEKPKNNSETRYVIRPGESLLSIATDKYHDPSKWREIYDMNINIIGDDPNKIYPYHIIRLKGLENTGSSFMTITMVVQRGETLWSIAEKVYGNPLAWSILWEDNQFKIGMNENAIAPGLVLKIRSKL